ncbi:MAG: DUF1800 family protein [Candidatus Binataceae bacterium]
MHGEYGFFFDPRGHDYNIQTFLDRPMTEAGIESGERALDMLAASPATANHLSYQLAQYFVAENPPTPLVEHLARRYLASDGEIRAVLETMCRAQKAARGNRAGHENCRCGRPFRQSDSRQILLVSPA